MGSCASSLIASYKRNKMKKQARRRRRELRHAKAEMHKSLSLVRRNKSTATCKIQQIKSEASSQGYQARDPQQIRSSLQPYAQLLFTSLQHETRISSAITRIDILEANIESVYTMGVMSRAFQDATRALQQLNLELNAPNITNIIRDLSRETERMQTASDLLAEGSDMALFPNSIEEEVDQISSMHTEELLLNMDGQMDDLKIPSHDPGTLRLMAPSAPPLANETELLLRSVTDRPSDVDEPDGL